MVNLNQTQVMQNLLEVLIEKIGEYTSKNFATLLLCRIIMDIREEHEFFNQILINETRYGEGIEALTVSEGINEVDELDFLKGLKTLINKTVEGLDSEENMVFINSLHESLPDVFFEIDKIKTGDTGTNKHKIIFIGTNPDIISNIKNDFESFSENYEINNVGSGVECFDLLETGYNPDLIMIDDVESKLDIKNIFQRLKSYRKDFPILYIEDDSDKLQEDSENIFNKIHKINSLEFQDLKNMVDKIIDNK